MNNIENEAYVLKVLIGLVINKIPSDKSKIEAIEVLCGLPGCLPGRAVGSIFSSVNLSQDEKVFLQNVVDYYG